MSKTDGLVMSDRDLHFAGVVIRESGTDQLHVASGASVFRFATFTEHNAVPVAATNVFAGERVGWLHLSGVTAEEFGAGQLHIATGTGVLRATTVSEYIPVSPMAASTFAVRAWQVLDVTADQYNRAVLTIDASTGTRQIVVAGLSVNQVTERINRSEYHGNEVLAR